MPKFWNDLCQRHSHRWRLLAKRGHQRGSKSPVNRSANLEPLEPRLVLNADLVISEVVAINDHSLLDYDDSDSDWFEIHNRGTSTIDLNGWHFTDDLTNTTQWQVPVSTVLAHDERLIVFASNKDTVTLTGELHTNFKFNGDGESVGLADPTGQLMYSFDFPTQAPDVSYGLNDTPQITPLVTSEDAARALVPADHALGTDWAGGNEPFDDTGWINGTTGVGYETEQISSIIDSPIAYWTFDELTNGGTTAPDAAGNYDGTVSGATLTEGKLGRFGEALAFDGDNDFVLPGVISEMVSPAAFSISLWFHRTVDHAGPANETNHSVNNVLIAQSSNVSNDNLEIGTEGDQIEVYLDTAELGGSIQPVRQPASLQNDTWHHLVVSYASGTANEFKIYVDGSLVSEHSEFGGLVADGGVSPFTIGISRPHQNEWGDFEGLIDDVAVWETALNLQHVSALFNGTSPMLLSGYSNLIGTDLQNQFHDQNTSAYVRIPFTATNPESFSLLRLRMRYDDAFVTYINGWEVARSNVTGTPQFNSAADVDRPDEDAFFVEDFFLANPPSLLANGQNVLAIQLINSDAAATRALVLPELDGIQSQQLLIAKGTDATAFVPNDNTLGTTWTGSHEPFDDASWTNGTTAVGYDTGLGGPAGGPVAYWRFDTLSDDGSTTPDVTGQYDGTVIGAILTSEGQGKFGEALSFDGDNDSVSAGVIAELISPTALTTSLWFRRTTDHNGVVKATNHSVNNVLIAQSSNHSNDNLEIGTEENFVEIYLDTTELGGTTSTVREQATIQDDSWHHLGVTYESSDANELKLYLDGTLINQYSQFGGPLSESGASPFTLGVSRPGQNGWGDFEGLIDDVAVWDEALTEEQIVALSEGISPLLLTGFADRIGIDQATEMVGKNTTLYVRVPFTLPDPDAVVSLNLDMQFDDGYVAYINGTEVARNNLADTPQWNSAADSDRSDLDAFTSNEEFVANQPGLLQAGRNMLAIQALNASVDAERLLVLPQLEASILPGSVYSFMETPTPGRSNEPGLPRFMNPATFSAAGGTYLDTFSLVLTTDQPDAQIRYTTDLSVPTKSSPLYTAPISISETTQIRTRVYGSDSVASEVSSQTYVRINPNVKSFSSDLPLLVIENFGRGIPHRTDQNSFLAVFEPDATGRSRLTNPADLTARLGSHRRGAGTFSWEKTNYKIETRDEADEDLAVRLVGLPPESDFVLKGPYLSDRTLLRNPFIYELSRQVGQYSPRVRFVELFANTNGGSLTSNEYMGIYHLTEFIKGDENRVDITRLSSQHNTEPDVTGGYIIDLDDQGSTSYKLRLTSDRGTRFIPYEPELGGQVTNEQEAFLLDFINQFENALYGPNFKDPEVGYRAFIDVDSLITDYALHYLGQKGYTNSAYFAKNRSGKLTAAALWDFDDPVGAEGNEHFTDSGPKSFAHIWFPRLFQDPDFAQLWVDRWQELRKTFFSLTHMSGIIDEMAAELEDALPRNFNRWPSGAPNGGLYSEPKLSGYDEEISHLKGWLLRRTDWTDSLLVPPVSFSADSQLVESGFELILSGKDTIYYTLDGSDPRTPGGGVNPQAAEFTGHPIVINDTTKVTARAFRQTIRSIDVSKWSGPTIADFRVPGGLVISEVYFNPHDAVPAQGELDVDNDAFEFIELANTGTTPVELGGMRLTQVDVNDNRQGVDFTFAAQTLNAGEHVVVVKNRAAFESRYGTEILVAIGNDGQGGNDGEFGNQLSNNGEQITLIDSGIILITFTYNDKGGWPQRTDGGGSSLELIDPNRSPEVKENWRASTEYGGTPGTVGLGPLDSVIVNEVLTNTDDPDFDTIELYNPTAKVIDIGGWWLSDRLNNPDKFVIPLSTVVPAGGYFVLDQSDFGFGLNSVDGEEVVLIQPEQVGESRFFVDHVTFGAALLGESIGRWPNGIGELFPMDSTTFGAENSGPRVGPVIISEIQYNPLNGDDETERQSLEFVELYNPTAQPFDLSGWRLDGIAFDFPEDTAIDAGQSLVLLPFDPHDTISAAVFEDAYHVDIATNLSRYLGPYPGQLDNRGEPLTLQRAVGDSISDDPATLTLVLEDQVIYDRAASWPTSADGSGFSLHRTAADLFGNDAANWKGGFPSPGRFGTPTFAVFDAGLIVFAEAGRVTDLTHNVQTITLSNTFTNPVVFASPASFAENQPVVARVNNIHPNRFDLVLVEPSNQDGSHAGEEVSYVVFEAGGHTLSDGTYVEAGTVVTNATVGSLVTPRTWQSVNFAQTFDNAPAVLSQPQTLHDKSYLDTRQNAITSSGFDVALQQEEAIATPHVTETIGYLALDQGTGSSDGILFEAKLTDAKYSGVAFDSLSFDQHYSAPPIFLASMSTFNGADNAHLRFINLDDDNVLLTVQEDTSRDIEISHTAEGVAYLAIQEPGSFTSLVSPIDDGQTRAYEIQVDDSGRVDDLNVMIDLIHTHLEDLDIYLEAPDGTMVELLSDVGGAGNDLTGTTLDDQATQSIATGTAPFTGRFQPAGRLSSFKGKEITGRWTLHVTDDRANAEGGSLIEWSMIIDSIPIVEGNLNHDSFLDATDIDVLFSNLGSRDPTLDLDADGDVDRQDIEHLVLNVMGTVSGDVDLDGDVDIHDGNSVITNYDPKGENSFNGWAQGNFSGDSDVDISDILQSVMNFSPLGYHSENVANLTTATIRSTPKQAAKPSTSPTGISTIHKWDSLPTKTDHTAVAPLNRPLRDLNHTTYEQPIVDDYFQSVWRKRMMNAEMPNDE